VTRATALLLAVLGASPAWAGEAKLAIDFAAAPGSAPWYANALQQTVAQEASRFSRVAVVDPIDTSTCAGRDTDCVVHLYTQAGVDVLVLGVLDRDTLRYEVHETWTPGRAFAGSLAAGGANVTSRRLQHQVAGIVRPIVSSGGLLDKRPASRTVPTQARKEPPLTGAARQTLALFAAALALLLWWPPLLLALLVGLKPLFGRLRSRARLKSWAFSATLFLALVAAALFALLGLDLLGPLPDPLREVLLPLLGGLLWGALAVLHVGFVFPPLQGLSRIRHEALSPTLRAWLSLCALRGAALLAWLPLISITLLAARTAELSSRVTLWLLLPCVGLYGCFWLASLVDHLSAYLDDRLVEGSASAANPWHATARKYFLGYVKRGGLLLDRGFLERALFLPGRPEQGTEVLFYGGGFGPPRVLIGATALTAALGELPDEPEAPERIVNLEELPAGFVVPQEETGSGRAETRAERLRKRLTRAAPRRRAPAMPRLLGEPTTALGWVVPRPVDEAVPLISNTREDYEVVKGLLTEHYGRFEKNLDEDDHDDTDPTQKDFLFGALLVAAGAFTRRDHLLGTLARALALGRPHASWPSRMLMRGLFGLHARFVAWPRIAISDAYAALNNALHPLIQHLHLKGGGALAVLTARADAPHLVEISKTLLEGLVTKKPSGDDTQLYRPTPRNRMLWLAPFFAARLAPPRARALRALTLAAAAALVMAVAADQLIDALNYRPIYVDRMTQMRAMAEKAAQRPIAEQGVPPK
jgi:hypothetical protein